MVGFDGTAGITHEQLTRLHKIRGQGQPHQPRLTVDERFRHAGNGFSLQLTLGID